MRLVDLGVNVVLGVMCGPGGGIRNCDRRKTEQQLAAGQCQWKRRNGWGCAGEEGEGEKEGREVEGDEAGGLA